MTTTTREPKSLVAALRDYFGILPGQTTSQFMAEYKQIEDKDRPEWARMLTEAGYPVK